MKHFLISVIAIMISLLTSTVCFAEITYEVVEGDTLKKIAAKYSLNYEELGKYNQMLNYNRIFVGQNLLIPIEEQKMEEIKNKVVVNKKISKPESSEFVKYVKYLSESLPIAAKDVVLTLKELKLENIDEFKTNNQKISTNYYGEIQGKQDETIYLSAKKNTDTNSIGFQAEEAIGIIKAIQDTNYIPNKTICLFLYEQDIFEELNQAKPNWIENCFAIVDMNSVSKNEQGYSVKTSCDLNAIAENLADLAKIWNINIMEGMPIGAENSVSYLKLGIPAAADWVYSNIDENENLLLDKDDSIFLKKAIGKILFDLDSLAVKPLNLSVRMKISAALNGEIENLSAFSIESEKLSTQIQSMNNVTIAALAEGDIKKAEKILAQADAVNKMAFEMNLKVWNGIE